MIRAVFFEKNRTIIALRVSGHAMRGSAGTDIVCAAVSSAVYMAVNTVTDVIGAPAEATVNEGELFFETTDKTDAVQTVLAGLELHLRALQKQYPDNITVERCLEC